MKLEICLADAPTERILKRFKEQEATMSAKLEIDAETRFVRSFSFELVRGEHKRQHEGTATYEIGKIDDAVFEIPAKVQEAIERHIERLEKSGK